MVYRKRSTRYAPRRRLSAARKIGRFVKRGWSAYKKNRGTIGQLVRDVAMVKSMVNAEKKYVAFTESFNFGSLYNAGSGHWVQSLISLSQGTTAATRTGNSVKATSLQYALQIAPMTNTTNRIEYTIFILLHPGALPDDVYTTGQGGTLANTFLDTDYGGVSRTNRSLRNVENFRNWIVLKRINGKVDNDESSTAGSEIKHHTGAVKLWQHMKFNGANTPCIQNQIYYLFVANNGDAGTALTGLTVYSQYRFHFIDN